MKSRRENRLLYDLFDKESKQREILKAINNTGSLSEAAKLLGISYKTVWNCVVNLNSIFKKQIVTAKRGGVNKGGAYLTEYGRSVLSLIDDVESTFDRFLEFVNDFSSSESLIENLLKRYMVRTSARNQFLGKITGLKESNGNVIVEIETLRGDTISASLTKKSCKELKILEDRWVFVLIKAPKVILKRKIDFILTDENVLKGKIKKISIEDYASEVIVETEAGTSFVSVVSSDFLTNSHLKVGDDIKVVFKASDVIVGI